jgi:hypothetical protein
MRQCSQRSSSRYLRTYERQDIKVRELQAKLDAKEEQIKDIYS